MSSRKNSIITAGFAVSVSLIASALAVMLVLGQAGRRQFELLNAVCEKAVELDPEAGDSIAAALKECTGTHQRAMLYETGEPSYGDAGEAMDRNADKNLDMVQGGAREDILTGLGYSPSDFMRPAYRQDIFFVLTGAAAGSLLFLLTFFCRNRKEGMRIRALADYLEQVPEGKALVCSASGEDDFSKLEDAIYKNVTYLYQTKDAAVQAKNEFAENLSNIAHQIKTPITAMSLSVQMMKQEILGNHLEKIEKQILRLNHLQEALLVLSRLDAGALTLKKDEVDVYTLFVLAADNLQELFVERGASIDIPELGELAVTADLDWTMEAVMNLMKNCMEHSGGGRVYCSYEQNLLYTEILIWDQGKGFAKEDIPHLFERFYRGKNAGEGGIGIGLALAKELIERQNGLIRAKNMPDGGACFEIRFYRH